MAIDAGVPFDSASDPCSAHAEVGGLEDRVDVQQFAAGRLVDERPQSAADFRQDRGLQKLILQDQRHEIAIRAVAVVVILTSMGQPTGIEAIAEVRAIAREVRYRRPRGRPWRKAAD